MKYSIKEINISKKSAFTLVEMLTVITVILILLGLFSPALSRVRSRARIEKAKAMISSLEVGVNMYYTDFGDYPPEANWDTLLVDGSGDYGPYIDGKDYNGADIIDPWGNAYNYDIDVPNNTNSFDIWSNGPDGVNNTGGSDDISNW